VREFVEGLSADEKIAEGDYLSIMNHMKKVFDAIPPAQPKHVDGPYLGVLQHVINGPTTRQRAMDLWDKLFNRSYNYIVSDRSEWMPFSNMSWEEILNLLTMIDSYLTDPENPDKVLAMYNFLITQDGISWKLNMGYWNLAMWKDFNHRDIWLNNPVVRKENLDRMLRRKADMADLIKIWGESENGSLNLSKVMCRCHVPFQGEWDARRGVWAALTDKEKSKLHSITVSLALSAPKSGQMRETVKFKAYTDLIQLARGKHTYGIYQMAVAYAIISDYTGTIPMETIPLDNLLLYSNGERLKYYSRYYGMWRDNNEGKMLLDTSGITAHTREKRRRYVDANGVISIEYTSLLNSGSK
jgi:hypothetical protein